MKLGNCAWRLWPDAWFTRVSFTLIKLRKTPPMCYSNHSHFFTLQQLRATTQAGGVSGVVLKAQGDAFFIEIEMRSGHYAVLVTARGKEPRRFKNPLRALAILRDIGIVHGQFDLSLYAPEQLNTHDKNATADLFTNTPRRSGSEPKRTTLTSPATQTEAEHTQPSLLGPTRTVKSKTPAPVPVAKSKGSSDNTKRAAAERHQMKLL